LEQSTHLRTQQSGGIDTDERPGKIGSFGGAQDRPVFEFCQMSFDNWWARSCCGRNRNVGDLPRGFPGSLLGSFFSRGGIL
jgi:hypothetical protein